jgi:preprotein translocase subunit YajC
VLVASSGWGILTALLPFLVLLGFWVFLMRVVNRRRSEVQEPVLDKLEQIRQELERLRRAIESRP